MNLDKPQTMSIETPQGLSLVPLTLGLIWTAVDRLSDPLDDPGWPKDHT